MGGYGEAYMEIVRSFHALSHVDMGCSIVFAEYNVVDGVTADLTVGNGGITAQKTLLNSCQNAFAISQELELWANRSDVLISGMNTLASQVFFECNLNTAPLVPYTLDFYANCDIISVIENGLLSARY